MTFQNFEQPIRPCVLVRVGAATAKYAQFSHGSLAYGEKAENAERCGDPHPEAGRLLQESEESRHAVTVPPSEAVTSRTAPVHPRDGVIDTVDAALCQGPEASHITENRFYRKGIAWDLSLANASLVAGCCSWGNGKSCR